MYLLSAQLMGISKKSKFRSVNLQILHQSCFMIVNTDHIHADLMVFEKDVHKVKKGQDIFFSVQSVPGATLSAKIYSVGKTV